jgi:hypothetical protein
MWQMRIYSKQESLKAHKRMWKKHVPDAKNLANFRLEFNKEQEEGVATTGPISKQTMKLNYGWKKQGDALGE